MASLTIIFELQPWRQLLSQFKTFTLDGSQISTKVSRQRQQRHGGRVDRGGQRNTELRGKGSTSKFEKLHNDDSTS
jgi:hypothetical protein